MRIGEVEVGDEDFAEAFPMWVSRILVTAASEDWARAAAAAATGFATSIIMAPCEAGVEGPPAQASETPDGRVGLYLQFYHGLGSLLKQQLIARIGQCILTCPSTAVYDATPDPPKRLKIGWAVRMFGDGFEERIELNGRTMWRIPVMEGEFLIEDRIGVRKGIAGGNILIMASEASAGLRAAESAVEAIRTLRGVVLPFPGGVCRSGSKVGSRKYKLKASTNHPYCPLLKGKVEDSQVPEGVKSVYEIVFNALSSRILKKATALAVRAAAQVGGVKKITAVNFGGRLGPIKINLKEALESEPS
ncbi:MAG: formylmethanofuran--tetrahydromethanopterin N-formyltransferase [Candidatus Bathyarchaeia archaeon]